MVFKKRIIWGLSPCHYLLHLPKELPAATKQQIIRGRDGDVENTRVPQDSNEMKQLLAA